LRTDFAKYIQVDIKKNEYELFNSLLYFGATPASEEGEYYNVHSVHTSEVRPNINTQKALYTLSISLHPINTSYTRFSFTLFNALEDYGGILEVILSFFELFLEPYTIMYFNLSAMSAFYLVRTKFNDFLS
jgi:hypothetical protein